MKTNGEHWKSKHPNYRAVHAWLTYYHGKASKCEMPDCNGRSKMFHWALKRDKDYEKNIENFMQLCSSCHKKYDLTEETKLRLRESGKINSWFVRDNPMNYSEVRAKISASKTKNLSQVIDNNKPVTCANTGARFENVSEAAFSVGLKISALRNMLNGSRPNKTSLVYADS